MNRTGCQKPTCCYPSCDCNVPLPKDDIAPPLVAWLKAWWTRGEAWRNGQRAQFGPDVAHLMRGVADMIEAAPVSAVLAGEQRARLVAWCEEMAGWCLLDDVPENERQFTAKDRANWQALAVLLRHTPYPSTRASVPLRVGLPLLYNIVCLHRQPKDAKWWEDFNELMRLADKLLYEQGYEISPYTTNEHQIAADSSKQIQSATKGDK